jgi:hypothetical protein
LVLEHAAYMKKMQDAIASREWMKMGPAAALKTMRDLLGQLQDEYSALSEQAIKVGKLAS